MLFKKNIVAPVFFAIFIFISFYITTFYFKHSVFNDFITRVIGSRLADAEKSAYFHKWNPDIDNLNLLDPHEKSGQIVNGNTVTPTVLLLLKDFNKLPLHQTTAIWFWLSYAAIFFIFYLFHVKQNLTTSGNKNILFIFSLSFLLFQGWQMHLLVGQIYIYYTALAVSSFYFFSKNKFITSAVLAGILTALRFPALLLFLPIILLINNKIFTRYYLLSLFLLLVLSCIYYGTDIWFDYFKSMQIHGLENAGIIPEITTKPFSNPNYIEGIRTFSSNTLITHVLAIDADIFSVQKLLVSLQLPSNTAVLLLLFSITIFLIFYVTNRFNKNFYKSYPHLLLFSSLAFCIFDYFLPALRFNYNFVQFLIVFSILFFYTFIIPKYSMFLLGLGLFLNIIKLKFIPECYSVGEVLCIISVIQILIKNKVKNEVF